MDSLTHIVLGAAIGEATLGKKIGKKAMFWGALVATAPDIDVFIGVFMNDLDKMIFHRGWTHSILLILLFSPVYGWIMNRFNKGDATWREWTYLAFLAQITHTLLDSFTSYGTQLFLPLSNKAVSLSTISVVDPIFTIPLIVSVTWLVFSSSDTKKRRLINYAGLALASSYLIFTIFNKSAVESRFLEQTKQHEIEFANHEIKPTLFNNLLWRGIFDHNDGTYSVGYYSVVDGNSSIRFHFIDGNHSLIKPYLEFNSVQRLIWVSNGFFKIEETEEGYLFSDLRFGRVAEFRENDSPYAFSYYLSLSENGDDFEVERVKLRIERDRERSSFRDLWNMIRGISD